MRRVPLALSGTGAGLRQSTLAVASSGRWLAEFVNRRMGRATLLTLSAARLVEFTDASIVQLFLRLAQRRSPKLGVAAVVANEQAARPVRQEEAMVIDKRDVMLPNRGPLCRGVVSPA